MDTKVDYNVNNKFNLAGTFGVLHYKTGVLMVLVTMRWTADRRQQQPRPRPRQHVSLHDDGHVHLHAHAPDGRALRVGEQKTPLRAAWPGHQHRRRPGDSRNQRPACVRERLADVPFEDFATIGVNENFMPYYRHDPQTQYVVNFNWPKNKHNIRFGGDFYHMGLNQAQAEFITGGFGAQGGFGSIAASPSSARP